MVTKRCKKLQGKYLTIISHVSRVKLHCRYVVNIIITVAVIALSVALLLSMRKEKTGTTNPEAGRANCPRDWIGFGSKCFYFSEVTSNWTSSQTSCMTRKAHLARFDSLEELDFLKRHKNDSARWIGLHRKSSKHSWRWTDNTKYNNLVPIRGEGERAYLSDRGISSGRDHMEVDLLQAQELNFIVPRSFIAYVKAIMRDL
ncbi:C-type lectin domain family 2 member H-like [Peromyscus californicus insignis]|uniref:C-type lectin domain family 2 member H-like n=1 Tax=Peromyscus californicus insignis TaxID=564181 RepID=UPI0022A8094E|nr:C-type lectin domain family 2 member H-like [Peromyscus californicus insignis]